jgi:hypothetical protein
MIGDVRFTLEADKASAGKSRASSDRASAPVAAGKPRAVETPPARKKALVTPPQSELSMEFPVPIDDDDGFSVPPPAQNAVGGDTDGDGDDFIPLKQG